MRVHLLQIANLISESSNKVYLSSEALLVNQLGVDTALTANDKAAQTAAKPAGKKWLSDCELCDDDDDNVESAFKNWLII